MNGYDVMVLMRAASDADVRFEDGMRQSHLDGNGICCVKAVITAEGYDEKEVMGRLSAAVGAYGRIASLADVRAVSPMICEARDGRGYMRYRQEAQIIYEGEL
ncbi:MAG: hypothetical protein IJ080_07150 [Oscillospiraceae bacterium]|nr:hypothetical protein [Oscillospiraceae bacterium]MBQ8979517.1 hypothetical protein [Oscillospiraceae bacterium]